MAALKSSKSDFQAKIFIYTYTLWVGYFQGSPSPPALPHLWGWSWDRKTTPQKRPRGTSRYVCAHIELNNEPYSRVFEERDVSQIYKQASEHQGNNSAWQRNPHAAKRRRAFICDWWLSWAISCFPIMSPIETLHRLSIVYSRRLREGDSVLTKEQKQKKRSCDFSCLTAEQSPGHLSLIKQQKGNVNM